MEMGGCVMRTAILGGMLLLASLCGEAAWTPGQFWVYEVRGTVPLWCPSLSYPGSFSHSPSMETVYVLRVSEDMVVLGIVALGQGRMAVCVVPVREGSLRPGSHAWLPSEWAEGVGWTVADSVQGLVGGTAAYVMPDGEEVDVRELRYFHTQTDREFLSVLYMPAHGLEVKEFWNTPCCTGIRRLVGQGVLEAENAVTAFIESVLVVRASGSVEDALQAIVALISLGVDEARELLSLPPRE